MLAFGYWRHLTGRRLLAEVSITSAVLFQDGAGRKTLNVTLSSASNTGTCVVGDVYFTRAGATVPGYEALGSAPVCYVSGNSMYLTLGASATIMGK